MRNMCFEFFCGIIWKAGLPIHAPTNEMCKIEGVRSVSKSTAGEWYKCFNEGDTSLEDKPHSGKITHTGKRSLACCFGGQALIKHLRFGSGFKS